MAIAASALSFSCDRFSFQEDNSDSDDPDPMEFQTEFSVLFQRVYTISNIPQIPESKEVYSQENSPTQSMPDESTENCEMDEMQENVASSQNDQTSLDLVVVGEEAKDETETNASVIHCQDSQQVPETKLETPQKCAAAVGTRDTTQELQANPQVNPELSALSKKRIGRKERLLKKKDEKKAMRVNPSEFGFHLSLLPRMKESMPADDDEVDDAAKEVTPVPEEQRSRDSMEETVEQKPECFQSTNPATEESSTNQDDEAYFAQLGIDIHDSGSFHIDNEYLDWDGVHFSSNHETSPRSKRGNTSANGAKVDHKADCKTNSLTKSDSHIIVPNNCSLTTHEKILFLDLECSSSHKVYLRKDRDRKVKKVHVAVKSDSLTLKSIRNNDGRKKMYIHFRIVKKINIDTDFRIAQRASLSPMTSNLVDLQVAKAIRIKPVKPVRQQTPAPAQNLNYVLHETNTPSELGLDLVGFLLSIQNRDLTPEDYEMLLRLDDTVQAKTISKNVLDSLKTETVGPGVANVLTCVICMEPYQEGQVRKFLPCEHDFHDSCITSWLANSSQNCPLDGLPICDS